MMIVMNRKRRVDWRAIVVGGAILLALRYPMAILTLATIWVPTRSLKR